MRPSFRLSCDHISVTKSFLPPAYVVRREGNSFTLFVSSHRGGYPYPIMLCNISQNAMGQLGGTLPGPAGGGTLPGPARGVPWQGGTLGGPWPGGYPGGDPGQGGTLAGGYPGQGGTLPGGTLPGGTQLGQHKEYLLHGGRYASCGHAGGLSCL